jgi:hypothetical protein
MTALGGRPYGSRIYTEYDTEYRRPQPDGPRYPKVHFIALVQPEQYEKAHRAARTRASAGHYSWR